jgi:hypothetical protein
MNASIEGKLIQGFDLKMRWKFTDAALLSQSGESNLLLNAALRLSDSLHRHMQSLAFCHNLSLSYLLFSQRLIDSRSPDYLSLPMTWRS